MEWPEQLALGLPRPRDDEPPDLRAAIIAEVCDHLQTALRRELLVERDPQRARQRVLDSFGDPVVMACRLWYDAMREKIMSQRIMLLLSGLMTAACVGVCVVVVLMFRDARAVNSSLIAKLESLPSQTPSAAPAAPGVRKPLSVRLEYDGVGGVPATNADVTLFECKPGEQHYEVVGTRSTKRDGIADFGLIADGSYRILVETGKQKYLWAPLNFDQSMQFVMPCPSSPRRIGRVKFVVETPVSHEPLKKLVWGLTVVPLGEQLDGGIWWSEAPVTGFLRAENYFWDLTLDVNGGARRCPSPSSNRQRSFSSNTPSESWYSDGAAPHIFSQWLAPNDLPEVQWPVMEYAIIEAVCIDMGRLQAMAGPMTANAYGHAFVNDLVKEAELPSALPMDGRLLRAIHDSRVPRFDVKPDVETECKIALPQDFWRRIPVTLDSPPRSTDKP